MHILVPFVSAALIRTAFGALYVAPQTLPRSEYDFIVVGGNFSCIRSYLTMPTLS